MERTWDQGKGAATTEHGRAAALTGAEVHEEGSEPVFTLQPAGPGGHPRARSLRVVGPGRKERAYLERVGELEDALDVARTELEVAARVERGTARYLDRVEAAAERVRAEREELRQQLNRVLVALGASQEQASALRRRLARADVASLAASNTPRRQTWLSRLLSRRR